MLPVVNKEITPTTNIHSSFYIVHFLLAVVVNEFGECFAGMATGIVVVCVQTGFLLRSLLPTAPRKHVLIMLKIIGFILVKVCFHLVLLAAS